MRSGHTHAYEQWELGIRRFSHELGINYGDIPVPPPTLVKASPTPSSVTRSTVQAEQTRDELFLTEYTEWQDKATQLFWEVYYSLDLFGPWQAADTVKVQSYIGNTSADGHALVHYSHCA